MARPVRRIGRYELFAPIASGGMATVHLGRLVGTAGFSRTVAVKRLHDRYARDAAFVGALLEEARLTSRISHPHVAQTLDVVSLDSDVFLVMEYVHGLSLAMLMKLCAERTGSGLPPPIACSIVSQALHGLHAAHEAVSATREPLGLVHQDVSPQNIMVGADGSARVIDFGIAKATAFAPRGEDSSVRGKVRYMPPEQMRGDPVDRRTDVFSAGIVLYELLTGQRYYADLSASAIIDEAALRAPKTPSQAAGVVSHVLDFIVMRALSKSPADRFATAEEMALAIEETEGVAPVARVGEWLRELAADVLAEREALVAEVEAAATGEVSVPPPAPPEESLRGIAMRMRENPSASRMTASLVLPPADEPITVPSAVQYASPPPASAEAPSTTPAPRSPSLPDEPTIDLHGQIRRASETVELEPAFSVNVRPSTPEPPAPRAAPTARGPGRAPWVAASAGVAVALVVAALVWHRSSRPPVASPPVVAAALPTAAAATPPAPPPSVDAPAPSLAHLEPERPAPAPLVSAATTGPRVTRPKGGKHPPPAVSTGSPRGADDPFKGWR